MAYPKTADEVAENLKILALPYRRLFTPRFQNENCRVSVLFI